MEQNTELKSNSVLSELNHLVYEYLELNGMEKTLEAFTSECQSKSFPSPEPESDLDCGSKAVFSRRDANNLLDSFSNGDLEGFLEMWRHFLSHIQLHGEDLKKLEVYIRVHFAIYPKVYGESEAAQEKAMNALKEFFDGESDKLASDKSILPLLALPFVTDPLTHPTFYELFEPAWSQRLKLQLETTLAKYFELVQENIADHSMLAKIVLTMKVGEDGKPKSAVSELVAKYHQERFLQLMTTYRKVRRLLRGTRESYGKLLKVANELISGLEAAVSGDRTALEPTLELCFGIFPELFTPDAVLNAKPDKEYFKKLAGAAIFDSVLDSDVSLFFIGISDLSPESLNYAKIKTQLTEGGSPSEKLCLLQAIRWLLTRSTATCREYAMQSFMQSDLLGITSASSEIRDKLFACMLSPAPTYLKECFVRLLNSIASMKTGRTYLSSNTYCLEILVKSLGSFNKLQNESYICQMVIATLQKLSLRKKIRLAMIELNVIPCLVAYLKSEVVKRGMIETSQKGEASYNPYLMEYGWALLMNLCLHEESRGTTVSIAPDILTCVVQMLHTRPPRDVSPYVVSTLYSLLRSPDIFDMAGRIRLLETLEEILAREPPESQRTHPLVQLIDILRVNGFEKLTASAEINYDDDDDSDPDEFEPELEVPEGWVGSLELCDHTGDDLLIRNYLVPRTDVVLPNIPPPEVQQATMHMRPTTPSKSSHSSRAAKNIDNEPDASRANTKPKRSSRKIREPSTAEEKTAETRTKKLETGNGVLKKTRQQANNASSLSSSHIPNPNGTTVTIPPRNDPASSYYIQNVLNQKPGGPAPGAEALRRKLKTKYQRAAAPTMSHFESKQNKKILAETCLINMINGKYAEFDSGMYDDDIFASVTPPNQSSLKQKDQKSTPKNNALPPSDQKIKGSASGDPTD